MHFVYCLIIIYNISSELLIIDIIDISRNNTEYAPRAPFNASKSEVAVNIIKQHSYELVATFFFRLLLLYIFQCYKLIFNVLNRIVYSLFSNVYGLMHGYILAKKKMV